MWEPLFAELNTPEEPISCEQSEMSDKYHRRLKKIFKKYYHTAIRKIAMILSIIALAFYITDNIIAYDSYKTIMIILFSIVTVASSCILIYPLVRIHNIKNKKYKWHIGQKRFARNSIIFIDHQKSTPTDPKDCRSINELSNDNIYIILWVKKKKYAINTHTNKTADLAA